MTGFARCAMLVAAMACAARIDAGAAPAAQTAAERILQSEGCAAA
jgi:hypothetical protein